MREIKFRAWDKHERKMHKIKSIHFDTELVDCSYSGGVFSPMKFYELMQFTGLYGKNYKEIYEGDIFKSENGRIWQVRYGTYYRHEPHQIVSGYGWFLEGDGNQIEFLKGSVSEIIGNIYENPELLK